MMALDNADLVSVPARLRRLRSAAGITQKAAAEALGMEIGGYQRFENEARFKRPYLPLEIAMPLARLAQQKGCDPAPWLALAGMDSDHRSPLPPGVSDTEMVPFVTGPDDRIERAIAALSNHRNNVTPWLIRGGALVLAGYVPGDIVLIDHDILTPTAGHVVCAQVYDWQTTTAKSIIRLYEPPYLVSRSLDPAYVKPELVDDQRVVIRGTAIAMLRTTP